MEKNKKQNKKVQFVVVREFFWGQNHARSL